MQYRKLAQTGIEISEIGFGAWGIGGATPGPTSYGETDDRVSIAALEKAFELGINFYDTANVYGNGHSESLLGQVFRHRRKDIVISTKAGCSSFDAPLDFSPDTITTSVEGSLKRLQTDYIDLLMLHDPIPGTHDLGEAYEVLDRLKQSGKIRACGISVRDPNDCLVYLDQFDIDALQVNFNLMDQRLVDLDIPDLAQQNDCAIIARTPLCFGFLSDQMDTTVSFDDLDHRSRWPKAQVELWLHGRDQFKASLFNNDEGENDGTDDDGTEISLAALQFCISFSNIAAVIPGILSPEDAIRNAHASQVGPLAADQVNKVRDVYRANSFFVKRPEKQLAMADK